jgi:hypothetical protein
MKIGTFVLKENFLIPNIIIKQATRISIIKKKNIKKLSFINFLIVNQNIKFEKKIKWSFEPDLELLVNLEEKK